MKISKDQLRKIIAEEVREHVKKKLVSESKTAPRTVKATPAMLKRIIAEEAAKINEASDGGGYSYGPPMGQGESMSPGHIGGGEDHPDNRGDDYEDYYQRQEQQLKAAAAAEAERNKSERLEVVIMSSNFHNAYRSFNHITGRDQISDSILIDKDGNILCDLNNPYDDCAHAVRKGMANFKSLHGNIPYHDDKYINHLHKLLDENVASIDAETRLDTADMPVIEEKIRLKRNI